MFICASVAGFILAGLLDSMTGESGESLGDSTLWRVPLFVDDLDDIPETNVFGDAGSYSRSASAEFGETRLRDSSAGSNKGTGDILGMLFASRTSSDAGCTGVASVAPELGVFLPLSTPLEKSIESPSPRVSAWPWKDPLTDWRFERDPVESVMASWDWSSEALPASEDAAAAALLLAGIAYTPIGAGFAIALAFTPFKIGGGTISAMDGTVPMPAK